MSSADSGQVLILEDEPIIGLALEDMLESLGVKTVLHADTLPEARAILDSEPVDWAVLDVNIHGERSYQIADRLKALDVPFIFATGYGDAEHPQEHLQVPTLIKPYSLSDLEAVMKRSLGPRP